MAAYAEGKLIDKLRKEANVPRLGTHYFATFMLQCVYIYVCTHMYIHNIHVYFHLFYFFFFLMDPPSPSSQYLIYSYFLLSPCCFHIYIVYFCYYFSYDFTMHQLFYLFESFFCFP